jgi:hypothetical protein
MGEKETARTASEQPEARRQSGEDAAETGKAVEKGTSGVKQTMQQQV